MVEDGGLWQRRNGKRLNFGFGIYKGVFGMTQREREILIASVSWTDKSLTVNEEKAFQAGARWADKTMIEKACQWILCNMPKYVKANQLDVFINNEDMANDFKRTMEE